MAWAVLRPMEVCGLTNSMAPSLVAWLNSARALVSTPGAMTPPANVPLPSITSILVAVPKSTTTTGEPYSIRAATQSAMRSAPISRGLG